MLCAIDFAKAYLKILKPDRYDIGLATPVILYQASILGMERIASKGPSTIIDLVS